MKLFAQHDDKGRRSKTRKKLRTFKNKRERLAAKLDPECQPHYGKYQGWIS